VPEAFIAGSRNSAVILSLALQHVPELAGREGKLEKGQRKEHLLLDNFPLAYGRMGTVASRCERELFLGFSHLNRR